MLQCIRLLIVDTIDGRVHKTINSGWHEVEVRHKSSCPLVTSRERHQDSPECKMGECKYLRWSDLFLFCYLILLVAQLTTNVESDLNFGHRVHVFLSSDQADIKCDVLVNFLGLTFAQVTQTFHGFIFLFGPKNH